MKKIIASIWLILSIGCNKIEAPPTKATSEYISISALDGFMATELYVSGMHYKVLTGYKIGMSVINITRDSLTCAAIKNNNTLQQTPNE